ncbi:glycosyltransferase [Escherichia coli]|uniref:glycosyltransferase n=1 Tax=Escherichia coli TaxID=562 RepID=UPI0002C92219|nr:glycosyltransferase [Escherichia coli]EMW87722.1 glycosyl transferases group 1 family protein [Escherichia coli 180050]
MLIPKKLKVLHAAETVKGGVGTVINSLVSYQRENNEIDDVICFVPAQHADVITGIEKEKIHTFERNKRGLSASLLFSIELARIIINFKPDVIHLHSTFAGFLGRIIIFLLLKWPKIRIVYCPHAFAFIMNCHGIKKKLYVGIENLLCRITDKIICVSKYEYEQGLLAGLPKNKMEVIHNGVEIPDISLKIKNDTLKAIYVGRFDYQKGIDILHNAIRLFMSFENTYSINFKIIGDFVADGNSEQKIESKGKINIDYAGWLSADKIRNEYKSADLIIIPSRWEGFAMVPLEAMSYGVPVIASDIGPFKEIIKHGVSGILFHTEHYEELADILLNINKYDLDTMSTNALSNLKKEYTDTNMNQKVIKIYQ